MADTIGIQLAGAADTKVVFSGPPTRLQATIRLVNPSAEKLKIRSVGVAAKDLRGAAKLPLNEIPLSVRLAPGEQASVEGTISLDPQTPPGTYPMQLTVSGRQIQTTAHVTEVVDFRMEPGAITILAGKERSYERDFVIENAGNVPLPLGERCEAPLLDSMDLVTSMLTGLHNKREGESRVDSWLAEWASQIAGTLVVTRDPIILRPGQKIAATARFELPGDLKPLRHYQANLQLYNATLVVDIYTTANTGASVQRKPRKNS